jgi:hypothetical protein
MTPNDRFATSVALIGRFEKYVFHSDYELDGDIVLDDGIIRDLIYLDEEGGIDQIKIGNDIVASHLARALPPKEGERATVRLILNNLGKIYRNFDFFLNNSDHRSKKPEFFYVIDENIDSRDTEPKELLAGYNDIISFIDMLAQLSDIPDRIQSGEDMFFSGATRREILPVYTSTDIRALPDLAELRRNLLTELHHDEKRGIFKSTLLDLVSDEGDERALFTTLIQRYEVLKKKYLEAYNVYIQQFSADEIMQEVQERNIDLASKLHGIIVDLHKSLFALPIAFIFAATRIDSQDAYSLGNTIILICSLIAVLLFFLSLSSHWKTLNFVCKEIETQRGNASKYKGLEDKLLPPYDELISRCSFQRWLMRCLGVALLVVSITMTGLFFYLRSISKQPEQSSIENVTSRLSPPKSIQHMILILDFRR